jgi:RimJ/RimL family protein N-acetyltransferase
MCRVAIEPAGSSPGRPLSTSRLVLEPLTPAHAGEMVDVLADVSLYDYTGDHAPTLTQLTERYERQVAGPQDPEHRWLNWIIRLDGRAVGYVQATVVRHVDGNTAEVAWVVRPEDQGHGIASEAALAMVEYLRAREGVHVVEALIGDDNVASQVVARRLGMQPTGQYADGEQLWSPTSPGPADEH